MNRRNNRTNNYNNIVRNPIRNINTQEYRTVRKMRKQERKLGRENRKLQRLQAVRVNRNVNFLNRQFNLQRPITNRSIANIKRTKPGSVTLTNREFIGNVNIGFTQLNLEPGNSGCKVLDTMATMFDNHVWHKASIQYKSGYSMNDSGKITMGIDYNGNAPNTEAQIAALQMSKSDTVYKSQYFNAIPSRLMKTKLHANYGSLSPSTTVPTKAGTFVSFLTTNNSEALSQFWFEYTITFENIKGAETQISPTTTITSQNVLTPAAPQPVPSTVNSNQNQEIDIVAVELNAIDAVNEQLVNGFNIGVPQVGDNYSIVQSINTDTINMYKAMNLEPVIRVRDTDGNIVPSTYYTINGENIPAVKDKDFNQVIKIGQINASNISSNGFFGWVGGVINFIKDVASIVHVGSGIVLEILSPWASEDFVMLSLEDDVLLTETATACAKGLEVDVTLPSTVNQNLKDTFNFCGAVLMNQVYEGNGTGETNTVYGRYTIPTDTEVAPTKVFLGYRDNGSTGDFSNMTLTDQSLQHYTDTLPSTKVYAMEYDFDRNAILENFKLGDILKCTACLSGHEYSIDSANGFNAVQPIIGSDLPINVFTSPIGPLFTINAANYKCVGLIPTITSNDTYDHYFTLDPEWIQSSTEDFKISLDMSSAPLQITTTGFQLSHITLSISKFADCDRSFAIPTPVSLDTTSNILAKRRGK